MAVVGFEIDQVIPGGNPDGSDLSVPINAAYNHHYDGMLNNGKKSTLVKLEPGDPRINKLQARRRSTRAAPRGSLHEGRSTLGSQIFFILTCAQY